MIFFADANLTIQKSIPRPMNQGSSEADEFVLVAPIPENSTVSVAFKLPNGVYTEPHFVNPATGQSMALVTPELIGFTDQSGNRYTVWVYIPDRLMTSLPGVLSVQFFATNANGETRSSSLATITVGKGVPYIAPSGSATDVYQEILAYLSSVMQSEDNAEFWAKISQSYANGTIDEATAKITATPEGTTATINQLVFLAKVGYTVADKIPKEYVFTWDGEKTAWYLTIPGTSGSTQVVLSDYGITVTGYPGDAQSLYVEASVGAGTVQPGDPGYQDNAKYYADKAKDSNTQSEQAKADAVSAMELSIQAKNDAVDAKNGAESAKDTAVSAKNDAITAKNDAIAAQNSAKQSADAAEEALGQFTDLSEEFGASLDMTIDNNFILAVSLKNRSGYVLSEKSVDLPIESMVVNASYNPDTKKIVLTLQNGNTISVPVDDLVDGLASETYVRTYVAANTVSTVDGRRGAVTTCLRIDYGDANACDKIRDAISKNQRIVCVYKDYDVGMPENYNEVEMAYTGQDGGYGAFWFSADFDGISYQANVTPDNYWTIDSFDDKNTQTVKYVEQTLTDSEKEQARENINAAATDGFYQGMGVGNAEQLISTVGVTDKVPYNFRTAGGSADIGNRLNDKIVGGTIAWNQLINPANKSATIEFDSATGRFSFENYVKQEIRYIDSSIELTKGHKYLLYLSDYIRYSILYVYSSSFSKIFGGSDIAQAQARTIFEAQNNVTVAIYFNRYQASESNPSYYNGYIQFFDLTRMFGSAIADYVYSLEQTTAGAGVAWFKNLFPKPYYEYNAGELMSVCTNAHITTGFNQLEDTREQSHQYIGHYYINQNTGAMGADFNYDTYRVSVIPGATYYMELDSKQNMGESGGIIRLEDYNKSRIANVNDGYSHTNVTFTIPSDCYYVVFNHNKTNTAKMVLNLSWSSYRNGEYEPYVEHKYPLSPVELRGIPKLDSANNLYFDGDTYEKDGTVTRRYGKYTFTGNEEWAYGESQKYFGAPIVRDNGGKYSTSGTEIPNAILVGYKADGQKTIVGNLTLDKEFLISSSGYLGIRDLSFDGSTIEQFKQSITGKEFIFELATPTTETANPFADPQIVDDFGTEEYVDALATAETSPRDVAIPVGHETFYQANLRDKLQNLPANANADGLYLVKQTGNKQELIAYTPEDELPASPAETGTYILKLVDGTLTWVLES